jgi:iron complex transport system ATP-binding protein
MLQAENISYNIRSKNILTDCSLSVSPGAFTAVVGPNGAGKTSLLRILAGEINRYSGIVSLNAKDSLKINSRDLSKLRAVLPQHTYVNFPFTVEKIVEVGRYTHQTRRSENERIMDEIFDLTSLKGFKHRIYQTLSGGEQQRVQMARVMAQIWDKNDCPKYLLLDEPTASLDLAQQHFVLRLARELCQRNIGVLAILHDLNLAAQYADHVLFLKEGRTVAYGDTTMTMTKKTVEETFSYPVKILFDEDSNKPMIFPIPAGIEKKNKNQELKMYAL